MDVPRNKLIDLICETEYQRDTSWKLRFGEENKLAPGLGFEPRSTAPKAVVLPLDDPGVRVGSFLYSCYLRAAPDLTAVNLVCTGDTAWQYEAVFRATAYSYQFGGANGSRTRPSALKEPCANRCTMAPQEHYTKEMGDLQTPLEQNILSNMACVTPEKFLQATPSLKDRN